MSVTIQNRFTEHEDGSKGGFVTNFTGEGNSALGSLRVMTANPSDFTDPAAVVVELDTSNKAMKSAISALEQAGFRVGKNSKSAILEFPDINKVPHSAEQHGELFGKAIEALSILLKEGAVSQKDGVKLLSAFSTELMTSYPARHTESCDQRGRVTGDIGAYTSYTSIGLRTAEDQYRFHLNLSQNASPTIKIVTNATHGNGDISLKVNPDLLLPVKALLESKGIEVGRIGTDESAGFIALEHKNYLTSSAPMKDVVAALAETGLIPPLARERMDQRMANPLPDEPELMPENAPDASKPRDERLKDQRKDLSNRSKI